MVTLSCMIISLDATADIRVRAYVIAPGLVQGVDSNTWEFPEADSPWSLLSQYKLFILVVKKIDFLSYG